MPSVHRVPTFQHPHSIEEFILIRRDMLRYARSFPPGPERNQRRQIALSLRALFKNKDWLDTHTWEGERESLRILRLPAERGRTP